MPTDTAQTDHPQRASAVAAEFYRRYRLWTSILPAFATALVVFALAWVSLRVSGMQQESPLSLAGIFLIAVCAMAYELFSRIGFRMLGLSRRIVRRDDTERENIRSIISSEEEKRQEFEVLLLDIGAVPMFSVGGYTKNQLLVSRHTLAEASADELRVLMAHERVHLAQGAWLDKLLVTTAFWWIPAITAARLAPHWSIALVVAVLCAVIFVRVNRLLEQRQQQRADVEALTQVDRMAYARALARVAPETEPGDHSVLLGKRLSRAGYSPAEIDAALAGGAAAQA